MFQLVHWLVGRLSFNWFIGWFVGWFVGSLVGRRLCFNWFIGWWVHIYRPWCGAVNERYVVVTVNLVGFLAFQVVYRCGV